MERFGTHRSLEPRGVLPQAARVLDTSRPLTAEEALIEVEYLNVDSASWRQIRGSSNDDAERMKQAVLDIVAERGKLQNPVTGSGGILVGKVVELGGHRAGPPVGTRIATLVSLTLTPLVLDEIEHLDPESERVAVKGRAILFGSGIYAEVPEDVPDTVVLGVLDVCGAPAWVARLTEPGMKVAVIGAGGKSGLLACAQAARQVGREGRVLGLCWPPDTRDAAAETGATTVVVDCTDPTTVMDAVTEVFEGLADLVVVCANVPGCEGGAILSCDDAGRVLFFSMATSFSAAALTAEGLGKSCDMTIGNGYLPGHAKLALDLVRGDASLLRRFRG
jgi:L-erythro-3,5-diaminohexanoate dehydrogenase